jgi:GTPase Era involved in 16S rRNA processing
MQDIPVESHRMKARVEGGNGERTARIMQRVGAELAHMMKRHVNIHLRVKVQTNFQVPPEER